jgi:rubrerythrin
MNTHEGHQSGYERIRAQKTLREILEVAILFEKAAWDFYADLVPKVSKNLRWLVTDLAAEEQRHYELFTELAQRSDLAQYVNQVVATPASDSQFSDCVHLPDLGAHPDDQSVLRYALGREQAAMEQYRALAASAAPGPIQALFAFLANEETQHKLELEKIYYEIVHTGGV